MRLYKLMAGGIEHTVQAASDEEARQYGYIPAEDGPAETKQRVPANRQRKTVETKEV